MLMTIMDVPSMIKESISTRNCKYYVVIQNHPNPSANQKILDLLTHDERDSYTEQATYKYSNYWFFCFKKYKEYEEFLKKIKQEKLSETFTIFRFINGEFQNG